MGYAKDFLTMFIKKIHNRSGSVSVIVAEKNKGKYTKLATIGIARDESEVDELNVERAFRIAKSKIEICPMFHFTRKRIEAHVCICFVALKCYKELERRLKAANIGMSVDKVLNMAKTVTTIVFRLPESGKTVTKTMPMKRHQRIAKLFPGEFWGMR